MGRMVPITHHMDRGGRETSLPGVKRGRAVSRIRATLCFLYQQRGSLQRTLEAHRHPNKSETRDDTIVETASASPLEEIAGVLDLGVRLQAHNQLPYGSFSSESLTEVSNLSDCQTLRENRAIFRKRLPFQTADPLSIGHASGMLV